MQLPTDERQLDHSGFKYWKSQNWKWQCALLLMHIGIVVALYYNEKVGNYIVVGVCLDETTKIFT